MIWHSPQHLWTKTSPGLKMSVALMRTTSAWNCISSNQRDSKVTLGQHESKLPNTQPALQDISVYQTQLRLQQIRWNRSSQSWVATGNSIHLLFSEYTWWNSRKKTWGGKEIREQKNWDVSQYHTEVQTDWRRSKLSSCHFVHSPALRLGERMILPSTLQLARFLLEVQQKRIRSPKP